MTILKELYNNREGGQQKNNGRSTTGGRTKGNCKPDDSSSYDKADSIQTGSYHCKYYKKSGGKCDVCGHMKETNSVLSKHFGRRHAIHGRNTHLPATMKEKLRWFVYLEEDLKCELQYIGSTTSMTHRWANTKKKCNLRNSNGTGLETHFKEGCPGHIGENLSHIRITLLDHMIVTHEELRNKRHTDKPGCRCNLCEKLKDLEDKWICRMGTFNKPHGLNTRDEIRNKSRCTYWSVVASGYGMCAMSRYPYSVVYFRCDQGPVPKICL